MSVESAIEARDDTADLANRAISHPVQPVPLVVGVTGHRNLVESEMVMISDRVRKFFELLQTRFPDLPIHVMATLAEGADRLVARIAEDMGLPLIVPLPMEAEIYETDFSDEVSVAEFRAVCARSEVVTLPLARGNRRGEILEYGLPRDRQYAQMGVYIAAHCHILLALWDGKASPQLGGTAQVVQFHQYDVMPGFTYDERRTHFNLVDDESDLTYHIVCSRDQEDGTPGGKLEPGKKFWFTSDDSNLRSGELPERYARVFERMSEFNQDCKQHRRDIRNSSWPLISEKMVDILKPGLKQLDDVFRAADFLAMHYQKRVIMALRSIYSIAGLAGLSFIIYADTSDADGMIYPYLGFIGISVAVFFIAERRAWHRRYLDYRVLAEGLRVQFFWAVAGVRTPKRTKYSHDNFLQKQDIELGWIRNVMRVSGRRIDVGDDELTEEGVAYALDEWVGDETTGQMGYFKRKAKERTVQHNRTAMLGRWSLWSGLAIAVFLAIFQGGLIESYRNLLIALMGFLPLAGALREAYANKKADHELIKQYNFMYRIFSKAKRQLDDAPDDVERRLIFRALGQAALDENAEWILRQRERPLEQGKVG